MNPLYHKTQFLRSILRLNYAPEDTGYEVAFAGRSNAGKSSALNALTQQKNLARTSKTPGRTQLINFFTVDDERRLVDLPGYGYAKVPPEVQRNWHRALDNYFQKRTSLRGVFLIMDVRHPMTPFDQQMIEWCEFHQLPLHILLTKADKLKFGAAKNTLLGVRQAIRDANVAVDVTVQLFSATERMGIDEAHAVLDSWLQVLVNTPDDAAG